MNIGSTTLDIGNNNNMRYRCNTGRRSNYNRPFVEGVVKNLQKIYENTGKLYETMFLHVSFPLTRKY